MTTDMDAEPESRGRVLTDPGMIRALAHPARLAILESLSDEGAAATATELAGTAGLSPSATRRQRGPDCAGGVRRRPVCGRAVVSARPRARGVCGGAGHRPTVEYVVFDDEGHGFTRRSNALRAMRLTAEWFTHQMMGS